MNPAVGQRLGSTTCDTEVIVVRPPAQDVDLTCGGGAMAPAPASRGAETADDGDGSLIGKRYVHVGSGLELLCTKAGKGRLRVGDEILEIKAAKSLPSSD